MINDFMFTSQSVTEGHPDKMCDQISDTIVDHLLQSDPYARVRAECAVSGAILFLAVRFASRINADFTRLARKTIARIGYDHPAFNPQTCSILISPQALPVSSADCFDETALDDDAIDRIPAKNQVTVFGFACTHSPALMPLPVWLAHRLTRQLSKVRRDASAIVLQPDGKVHVGVEFRARKPARIHGVTLEIDQGDAQLLDQRRLLSVLKESVVDAVFADQQIRPDADTRIIVNPEGPYLGGPTHHSGLTGRKNAIDTYGEFSRHSGKALSGKDPMRIDRSGAYAARYAAKNIVAAGLADECEVMLSYAAGLSRPVSIMAQTFGTGRIGDDRITRLLQEHFDFRPAAILRQFKLRRLPMQSPDGFYRKLAAYGHFGREDLDLPWERIDKSEVIRDG